MIASDTRQRSAPRPQVVLYFNDWLSTFWTKDHRWEISFFCVRFQCKAPSPRIHYNTRFSKGPKGVIVVRRLWPPNALILPHVLLFHVDLQSKLLFWWCKCSDEGWLGRLVFVARVTWLGKAGWLAWTAPPPNGTFTSSSKHFVNTFVEFASSHIISDMGVLVVSH